MLLLYTQFIDFPTNEEIEFDLSVHNSQGFANGVRAQEYSLKAGDTNGRVAARGSETILELHEEKSCVMLSQCKLDHTLIILK